MQEKTGFFLSPRITSGLLEEKSYLIMNFEPLRLELQEYIKEKKINVSVYIENIRNGASMGINANNKYYPLSLTKVPIAIAIMQGVEKGRLGLNQEIPITEEDKKKTWDGDIDHIKEDQLQIHVLLEKMLQASDNAPAVTLLHYIDVHDLQVLLNYYPIDLRAYLSYVNMSAPSITARSMANIFRSLYLSTTLNTEHAAYILSLLANSTMNINEVAHLPPKVVVAHKYGIDAKNFHDCGILYDNEIRRVYCILTKADSTQQAIDTTGEILNRAYV
ncbi:serine hydrolase [Candidatus Woesearchaeota archaeon]|nr:serine hydrolase [Candidatus Woesearchaeota archaeon]